MKYTEDNIPEGLHLRVRYLTRRRNHKYRKWGLPETNARWTTVARLYDAEDRMVAEGVSNCSEQDVPNRHIGRAIAVGRALKAWHERCTRTYPA